MPVTAFDTIISYLWGWPRTMAELYAPICVFVAETMLKRRSLED
jgi:hypothetical protein